MISNNVLSFLKSLTKNNNKEWFHANREKYESAKAEFIEFVAAVLSEISKFDKSLLFLEPKKCIFRINRDIRFSNDKSPYKTHFAAWFSRDGRYGNSAGYYLHLDPAEFSLAGGVYLPESEILKSIRTEIYNYSEDLIDILKSKEVQKQFGGLWETNKLVKAPKGFDPNFEEIELLKHKHYILNKELTEKQVLSQNYLKEVVSGFKAMHPFVQFINRAIDENKSK